MQFDSRHFREALDGCFRGCAKIRTFGVIIFVVLAIICRQKSDFHFKGVDPNPCAQPTRMRPLRKATPARGKRPGTAHKASWGPLTGAATLDDTAAGGDSRS